MSADEIKAAELATFTPIRGMYICQSATGGYVKKADYDTVLALLASNLARAEKAEAVLAEAQKDSARLDWLEQGWGYKMNAVGKYYTRQEFDNARIGNGVTASFRDALDAAIAAANGGESP